MRLRPGRSSATQARTPWSLWLTSASLALVVLASYRVLEQRGFLLALGALALFHVLTVASRAPALSWHLFLSQTLVVGTTLASIFLHTVHVVGQVPPGWLNTLRSFVQTSLSNVSTYLYFTSYVVAFFVIVVSSLIATRALRLGSTSNTTVTLVTAYTMSAANVAFDYSLFRPLYHVRGEPDALAFFFTAGIFGVERSLPLHLLLLSICLLWRNRLLRRARSSRSGRATTEHQRASQSSED